MTLDPPLSQKVSDLADQCVRCGLCLPHCPTYQLHACEAESPRGRIALLKAVAEGALTPDPSTEQALDHCLSCRNCQSVCPAKVDYEQLLIQGRALIGQSPAAKPPRLRWLFDRWAVSPRWRHVLWQAYRFCHATGLATLARHCPRLTPPSLKRWLAYLPVPCAPFRANSTALAKGKRRGRVALLTGCSSDVLEPQTLSDSIRLLNHWGYEVILPQSQTCCGALHNHAGQLAKGERLARQNRHAWQASYQQQPFEALIQVTTGCDSTWQRVNPLPVKVWDIQAFLLAHWPASLTLQPLALTILVHEPCSQRNSGQGRALSHTLLDKIPGLHCLSLNNTSCCGAAGDYFSKHVKLSEQLASQLLAGVKTAKIDGVASANVGCRLQLGQHLRQGFSAGVKLYHPISLLALALKSL